MSNFLTGVMNEEIRVELLLKSEESAIYVSGLCSEYRCYEV